MKKFTIKSNKYLEKDVVAYAHKNYEGGIGRHNIDGTIENLIISLKNNNGDASVSKIATAVMNLEEILEKDLPEIYKNNFGSGEEIVVVCVPRSKANFKDCQLLFRKTVKNVVKSLDSAFTDGTNHIKRHTSTKTTHKTCFAEKGENPGGSGSMPYVGITAKTCDISNQVEGKNILLIDDLYTSGVNVCEDCLQTLLQKGAKNVIFYCVGVAI